jgi:hypothetical protein
MSGDSIRFFPIGNESPVKEDARKGLTGLNYLRGIERNDHDQDKSR